ncbi:zinc-finger domain-containing protein [Candidatus Nitrosacidococcus sp. I8]|uniref:zinc-finger domain-containing protein n=1 Tax=Candidatus Nitrosacidococcus sp. I8 TaxID=2942908 RepID=UPI00222785C0|nr:zinc-finger domain-containing protein [Candidatus Nitrosacidococcus sp. I8]CAH9014652.1 hypothetical protein NURINAE_00088 [Candidatus Nitrosacidococcus sp. I8]
MSETTAHKILPNAEHTYEVTYADLPLSCPMPSMENWNSHPRVYIPITETGTRECPYCSALYILKDWHSHPKKHNIY